MLLAGDVRVYEQIGLTAMHTLFVREHNQLAQLVRTFEPEHMNITETVVSARKGSAAETMVARRQCFKSRCA